MPAVTAPFLAAAVILAASGVAKLVNPYDTARALRAAGWPSNKAWVRLGAVTKIIIGAVAIALPTPLSGALVALAYGAFAVFVIAALRRGWALSSCGCFGKADTRPTYAHALLNFAAAATAGLWSTDRSSHLRSAFFHTQWHGGALAVVSLVITMLAYLVWTNPVPSAR